MGAQTVKEVRTSEAQRLVASGKKVPGAPNSYAIPSQNITVTVREGTKPGFVKLFITQGCVC